MIRIAFLRGMNLGNRRITNDELAAQFERIGLGPARTFRAAGNVVFDGGDASEAELTGRIESGLREGLGYPVPTVLRSAAELAAIVAAEPFGADRIEASKGKLQVMLLAARPGAAAGREALALAGPEDGLALGERELFWLPDGGVGGSDLDLKAIERALGLGTVRTMGTLEQLAAKHL